MTRVTQFSMSDLYMMIRFLFCYYLTAGISLGVQVHQSPPAVIRKAGDDVQLFCTHGQSDYRVMLWYQRSPGDKALKLVGYGYAQFKNDSVEEAFRKDFKLAGDLSGDQKNGSLSITALKAHKHTATYFCAARDNNLEPAYFGSGTRLTVLEPDHTVTEPKVTVLRPSQKECRNPKNKEREKTIVCVASKFYPDHVSVSWTINGFNVREGVATDNAALRVGKYYRITSRLRVAAETWYNPTTNFTCIVTFYNVTNTDYSAEISGETAVGDGMTRDKYLRITQTAKLSYGVFIIKSCIYGAFVSFLVWKLQGSAGKQHN